MSKYKKAAPRSEIKREIVRSMRHLDEVINHLSRAAAWAEEGRRPEVAEYLKGFAIPIFELQRAMERFLQEVLGYHSPGGSYVDESSNKETP